MAWMNNPKEMFCKKQEDFLRFVEDNFITSYYRTNVSDVMSLKNVLITGNNRKLQSNSYLKALNDDGVVFADQMIKSGLFFKTSDCQIIYLFSSGYDKQELELKLNKSWQSKNDVTVKVLDKKDNFFFENYNLVVMSLAKKELPILK